MIIIYFGNGSFRNHKRGIENVIDIQVKAVPFKKVYYLHWGTVNACYKYGNYICISLKNSLSSLFFAINVILKRLRKPGTIVHSHNPLMSFCYMGSTDIFTVHDGLYYQAKSEGAGKLKLWLFYLIEKVNYKRAKVIHFISEFTKKGSLFGHGKNYCIIPNTSFMEPDVPPNTLSPNIPADTGYNMVKVLSVRSIEERACFGLLLSVANKLQATHQFTVAGKGPLLEFYRKEAMAQNIKNIEFLGFVEDGQLKELYKTTDIVLTLAQYGEGFGLPIIEGYLFNKPVYASDKCAMPEVIIDTDYLVENTTESITAKILQPNVMEGWAYRSYYDTKYANHIILEQVKNLYQSIYSQKHNL